MGAFPDLSPAQAPAVSLSGLPPAQAPAVSLSGLSPAQAPAAVVIAQAGDTIDALCWRYLGTSTGTAEAALALNPHALASPILPDGMAIALPSAPLARPREIVRLWD